jgi:hypothetical protein
VEKTINCNTALFATAVKSCIVQLLNNKYRILSSIVHTFLVFYIENDAEIFLAHLTWKVAEKGFKMAFMMNNLAMINSCEIILEK